MKRLIIKIDLEELNQDQVDLIVAVLDPVEILIDVVGTEELNDGILLPEGAGAGR